MNWTDLKNHLAAVHAQHPQRAKKAELALKAAEEAIAELASLGHRFGLVEESGDPAIEWPKMLYRTVSGGVESKVFESELDLRRVDNPDDWRTTPLAVPEDRSAPGSIQEAQEAVASQPSLALVQPSGPLDHPIMASMPVNAPAAPTSPQPPTVAPPASTDAQP